MSIHNSIERGSLFHYFQGLSSTKNWERTGEKVLLCSELGTPEVILKKT